MSGPFPTGLRSGAPRPGCETLPASPAPENARKPLGLPPDPDAMNNDRAAWAWQALATFMDITGADRGDALADLLADLMHWCDRCEVAFESELARARDHYEAETLGEW